MARQKAGVIAAGHIETARAGHAMFEAGGTAFDAILAAMMASWVAEPCLTSAGGGGFLLAKPAQEAPVLVDFFVQTPRVKRPLAELDFFPVSINFGVSSQEFHVGLASIGVPGCVAGLFHLYERYATLPFAVLAEPAIRLARKGLEVDAFQGFDFEILQPILTCTPEASALFSTQGRPLQTGDWQTLPDLADTLEFLSREGRRGFYEGEIASALASLSADKGGYLTLDDMRSYRVIERKPLQTRYRGHTLLTNPPPSSGGSSIAFALSVLASLPMAEVAFGSSEHAAILGHLFRATARAKARHLDPDPHATDAEERLFSPDVLQRALAALPTLEAASEASLANRQKRGSTTHISVLDADGNAASITASNGEGCGYVLPKTGFMFNNMLGEADLCPQGFHLWPTQTRISSMMSPSLLLDPQGEVFAVLGTGGSNRIPTALVQVISSLLDYRLPVSEAVHAPRLHWSSDTFHLEAAFAPTIACGEHPASPEGPSLGKVVRWPAQQMFFGGVHTVLRDHQGLTGAGDRRRLGDSLLYQDR